jgi:hypothetical protein
LEQNPTSKGEQEVRMLKGEKDHLVDQLKQLVRFCKIDFHPPEQTKLEASGIWYSLISRMLCCLESKACSYPE